MDYDDIVRITNRRAGRRRKAAEALQRSADRAEAEEHKAGVRARRVIIAEVKQQLRDRIAELNGLPATRRHYLRNGVPMRKRRSDGRAVRSSHARMAAEIDGWRQKESELADEIKALRVKVAS